MDLRTWAPFQSKIVKEITEHMTEEEKQAAAMRGASYGIWVAYTLAIPFGGLVMSWLMARVMPYLPTGGLLVAVAKIVMLVCACLIAVHIVGIPIWLRKQKRFLTSTEWARQQGYSAKDIGWFR